jgi:hypothetical protein
MDYPLPRECFLDDLLSIHAAVLIFLSSLNTSSHCMFNFSKFSRIAFRFFSISSNFAFNFLNFSSCSLPTFFLLSETTYSQKAFTETVQLY